jgi:hypothetical protein
MWCGVELQPWAGLAAGDTGPWSALHAAQWQSIYLASKAVWPSGLISYAALQTSLDFANPTSSWSVPWQIFDAVVIDMYPGSDNTFTAENQFQTWFTGNPDPDPATVASVGQTPLIKALVNYSNSVGRGLFINQCGIIPADGNQTFPGQKNVVPPPFDFAMQSAWFQAVLAQVTSNYANFAGFFAWDGGANNFNSPYVGIDYWGIAGTLAGAAIDTAYASLTGTPSTLTAPTGLTASNITTTSFTVTWNALTQANISYVVQWSLDQANNWTNIPTANTSVTISNLQSGAAYDVRVFGVQGTTNGPTSPAIVVTTTSVTGAPTIIISSITGVTVNTPFTVRGTLSGYSALPTLQYVDDPGLPSVSGITETETSNAITISWSAVPAPTENPLPSGSTVTLTTFSFQHPGMANGNHQILITDGAISATAGYVSGTGTQQTISINSITATTGQTFVISGTLSGFSNTPVLTYADDGSSTQNSISGNTASSFSFTHPSWSSSGSHTVKISATGTSATATASYSVSSVAQSLTINSISATQNASFIVSGSLNGFTTAPTGISYADDGGALNNASGATISATSYSFNHPTISTSGNHTIAVQITGNASVSKTLTYTVSPATSGATISIDPVSAFNQSHFSVTGSLTGYSTMPTLVWQDDGGPTNTGITVASDESSYTFRHNSWSTTGVHNIVIKDNANNSIQGTQTYTVQPAYAPGPPTSIDDGGFGGGVTYNSISFSWNAPDAAQEYFYTVSAATASSGPFNISTGTTPINTPLFSLTGLSPVTNYWAKVVATAPTGVAGTAGIGGPFETAVAPPPVITIDNIVAFDGSTFTVSGELGFFSVAPTLTYTDDSGSPQSVTGTITATAFSFSHPAITTTGAHSITIASSSPAATATVNYNVGTALPQVTGIVGDPTINDFPNQVGIKWNIASGAAGYFVEISNGLSSPGTWIPLMTITNGTTVNAAFLQATPAVTSYLLNYYFRVTGIFGGGARGPVSAVSSGIETYGDCGEISAGTAVVQGGSGQISVQWIDIYPNLNITVNGLQTGSITYTCKVDPSSSNVLFGNTSRYTFGPFNTGFGKGAANFNVLTGIAPGTYFVGIIASNGQPLGGAVNLESPGSSFGPVTVT